jgi:hypothetical protein
MREARSASYGVLDRTNADREAHGGTGMSELRDGQILAVTTYCNGAWNDELRARHAAEAPMIRPLTAHLHLSHPRRRP